MSTIPQTANSRMVERAYPKRYLYRRLVAAKLYIDRHYTDNIDLDRIAGAASFSKYHFLRLFKKTYGRTPHAYLTELRISKARELLKENPVVADVCHALGFESLSSFTRLFKRHLNMTPSEYAEREHRRRQAIDVKPQAYVPCCFGAYFGLEK